MQAHRTGFVVADAPEHQVIAVGLGGRDGVVLVSHPPDDLDELVQPTGISAAMIAHHLRVRVVIVSLRRRSSRRGERAERRARQIQCRSTFHEPSLLVGGVLAGAHVVRGPAPTGPGQVPGFCRDSRRTPWIVGELRALPAVGDAINRKRLPVIEVQCPRTITNPLR